MAKPELGLKRQCQSCGAKFYDLMKTPITCPKCSAIFQMSAPVIARAAAAEPDDEVEPEAVAEIVSLDEAAEGDEGKDIIPDDDVDLGDDLADDDDTFLAPEEEEDDDVVGLIDGDIDTDEES